MSTATKEEPQTQTDVEKAVNDGKATTNINTNVQSENIPVLSKTESEQMLATVTASAEDHLLKELAFARFLVRCPCLLCVVILVIILIFCIIFGAVFELTLQESRTGFPDPPDQHVNDYDAYSLAAEFVEYEQEEETNSITQSEDIPFWQYFFIFELEEYANDLGNSTDYWILTPKNIERIIKFEDKIYKDREWHDRFCWVGTDPIETNYTCQSHSESDENAVISPARLIAEFYDYKYDSFTTEDAKNYTTSFLQPYAFCFNPGFLETGQTWLYRSFFIAGAPIGNGKFTWKNETRIHETDYENANINLFEITGQTGEYYEWGFPLYKDIIINNDASLSIDGLKVQIYSPAIHGNYLYSALNNSMVFLFLAILVVWAYMAFHLRSLFLACGAMFGILMSFPSAYFVYRIIFQIPIFDALSTLVVFVLLGVGADDVFVFTDAWNQSILFVDRSEMTGDDSEEQLNIARMSFTYRRASVAMLVTQITTFFAFLATATSILITMSAFGIWAACVIMMNYFLVITLYPAILMLHHKYIKKYEDACLCCCCRACGKNKNKNKNKKSDTNANANPSKIQRQLSRQASVTEVAAEYGKIEKFLGTKWAVWIVKFKYFILLFFMILFILITIGASNIRTASNTDEAFTDDHWFVITQRTLRKFIAAETDSLVPCHITFGISGVDRDGTRKYRPDEFYGTVIWDDQFEMYTAQQQVYLKYICESIKNRTDLVHSAEVVYCPIIDFEEYLNSKPGSVFPFTSTGSDAMSQRDAFAAEWNNFLESSYGETSMRDALSYNQHNTDTDTDIDSYDIKFYAMWFYSTLVSEGFTIDGAKFEAYLDELNEFIDDITGAQSDCPQNLCNSVGNPNLVWVFISIIKGYISSAIKGVLMALPLALIVMILATGNWIIALFALADIIGVMLSELSIMYLLGYEFSLTESIAIIVIIGFSVDYVVHLANAYLESAAKTREEQISFSLLTIGISVLSGAITTFLAGMFLVFAEFIFFKKMGAILMTTVLMSIFWAMTFFTALCAAFGPEGETGDLRKYFRMCCDKCKSKKDTKDVQSDQTMEMQAIR